MRKYFVTAALLSLCTYAAAQTITPTKGPGDDAINIGGKSATVTQTVNLKLPEATALHLDTTNLEFDISKIGQQDSTWYCAYGLDEDNDGIAQDVALPTTANYGDEFWGQTVVFPLGTSYEPVSGQFGKIKVIAGKPATTYPAIDTTAKEVNNASKAYFVCYRSFILQKFSNLGNFKLSVTRDTPKGETGKQLLYIQDNPCDKWGQGTGLYNLPMGATRELIPMSMTAGTTGHRAASSFYSDKAMPQGKPCRTYTSWLDDLVVVAVVVDGDLAGDNIATLTYTLESSATPFKITDSDATPFGNP